MNKITTVCDLRLFFVETGIDKVDTKCNFSKGNFEQTKMVSDCRN